MTDENIIDDSGVPELKLSASTEPQPGEPKVSHAPLGEVLLEARNAKKLTQKDVSNNLRISIKQITALETDDFALLPDAMITRGFIRNYARLLEIDAEPLLASYRAQMPDKAPAKLSVHTSMNTVMPGKDNQPWLIYILSSILILFFLLAWLFYVDYMPKPAADMQSQSVIQPVTVPTAEVALPEIALPAAERL
ncbi:MAG TPA: helix-turn-helix domain-containing protein, partial [Methylotenera sp.]|nr:helix-turn-helix domain-containing protein [Methylotenera sp.]